MHLSWQMKVRIAAAAAVGVVLIGILAWPLAAQSDPFSVVSILAGDMTFGSTVILAALAFLVGLIAFFVAWPFGKEIAVIAVPAGLAVWALRTGSMAQLIQAKATLAGHEQSQVAAALQSRQDLFTALKWEPFFWLVVVIAGFAGVTLASKIRPAPKAEETSDKTAPKVGAYLNSAIALVFSVLISQFAIRILAQDVSIFDQNLGAVTAQPAIGQIVFAVLVAFGLAAFVVKRFLNACFIWPTIASALVTVFATTIYLKASVADHLLRTWPAAFFSNQVLTILPIQMVALGTLGAIAGHWLAVRYTYWRKHE